MSSSVTLPAPFPSSPAFYEPTYTPYHHNGDNCHNLSSSHDYIEEADGLKDEIDRNNAIASAEDRFNYWMDIYPRSASLKGDFEELYKKHRESL